MTRWRAARDRAVTDPGPVAQRLGFPVFGAGRADWNQDGSRERSV